MALLQISEPDAPAPREPRLAVGIDLGTTNSLVATVRNGIPGRAAGRARAPAAAVDRPLRREVGRRRLRRAGDAGARSHEHDRLGEAADGPRARRSRGCAALSVPVHRRAGHGQARHACRREEPGRNFGGHPARAAHPRGSEPRGQARGRRRHGAGVFRRRAAAGDEGRRDARGPRRAAPPERADGGGDRLRARQRGAGHVRDLRPRRRHVRHLDPEADARRVRGARDERRLGARRRRLGPSRLLLDPRSGGLAAAVAGGHAAPDGEGARGEGEPHAASVDDDQRHAVRRHQGRARARRRDVHRDHVAPRGEDAGAGQARAARRGARAGRHPRRGHGRRRDADAADTEGGRRFLRPAAARPTSIRTRSWRWAPRSRPTCSRATARAATTGCCSTSSRCRSGSRRWAGSPRRSCRATRRSR